MNCTKVVKEQWHRDWNGEDTLCEDVDVFIQSDTNTVYIEQDGDEILLTTQQAIELREILDDVK